MICSLVFLSFSHMHRMSEDNMDQGLLSMLNAVVNCVNIAFTALARQ